MPDLTAEKFIFHAQYGNIYKTGDFARLLPDGSIYFIGRRDSQVKLRGQRFEMGEINNALLDADVVNDCVSIILESTSRKQKQLVTFWVPSFALRDESSQIGSVTRDLFDKLTAKLPAYMIPSLLIPVDTLPMTENGKADHRRLTHKFQQMPSDELGVFSSESAASGNDEDLSHLEKTIASLLSDITGTSVYDIRKNTSFYQVGLDSISAISLSRKLREAGFGQLDVSTILRQSSIGRLSAVISTRNDRQIPENLPDVGLEGLFDESFIQVTKDEFRKAGSSVQAIYPCTPLQEAMLLVEMSKTDSAYFNHVLFEFYLDFDGLKNVWDQLLKRHAIFRTCFKATNDPRFAYAQVVLENASPPLHYVEISANQLDLQIEKQKLHFQEQFQVSGMLPYSLTILRDQEEGKTFLLLSIHHALYDGEAMAQLFGEIQSLCSGKTLPEAIPFDRFIGQMVSIDVNASDRYWNQYLSGVSPNLLADFKTNKSEPTNNTPLQSHIDLTTPFDLFKEKCKEASVTPLNVLHTAWARLLSFYTNSSDVCFGNVFSCRTIPLEGADRIIGPCFNTLPVRIKFPLTATNGDVMRLARKSNSNTLLHQLSSLRRIQKQVLNDGSRLFDTLVILQTRSLDLDEKLWRLISEEGNMDFPFICEIIPDEKQNNVHICLHSQGSYILPADADLLARQFAALVDHTLCYPSAQASDKRPIGSDIASFRKEVNEQPRKFESLASAGSQPMRPFSPHEEQVQDILCKFAKADRHSISRDTTIFQLGLDSINAFQIAGSLRELGYDISAGSILEVRKIPVRDFVSYVLTITQAATVGNIATLLDSSGHKAIEDERFDFLSFEVKHLRTTCQQLQISEEAVDSLRPCTPVQNGMLAMFCNSNGDMYFNRMTLMPSERLNILRLKKAWFKVMTKHEILRTGFVQLQDPTHPFAMITYRDGVAKLPWYEATGPISNAALPHKAEGVLKNLHLPPWYLIAESSDSTTVLQLSALHAIYDAQSLNLILGDVVAAYRGEKFGGPVSINPTLEPILVESFVKSGKTESFWKELSKDVQPSKFPDLQPFRTEKKDLLVNSILSSKPRKALEDGCQRIGTTLQAAGQAAWARLLSAYTGEPSVVFGVVSSGRNLSTDAQEAVFPCLVTVPSPCTIIGTNRELLANVLKRSASLVKHQFAPLPKIQRWLKSDEGLFDTLFVYQKFSSQKEDAKVWNIVDDDVRIDVRITYPFLFLSLACPSFLLQKSRIL